MAESSEAVRSDWRSFEFAAAQLKANIAFINEAPLTLQLAVQLAAELVTVQLAVLLAGWAAGWAAG